MESGRRNPPTRGPPRARGPSRFDSSSSSASGRESESSETGLDTTPSIVIESEEELLTLTENESTDIESRDANEYEVGEGHQVQLELINEYEISGGDNSGSNSTADSCELDNDRQIEEILRTLNDQNSRTDVTAFSVRAGITTLLHPSQMAQILMQVTRVTKQHESE